MYDDDWVLRRRTNCNLIRKFKHNNLLKEFNTLFKNIIIFSMRFLIRLIYVPFLFDFQFSYDL